MSGSLRDDKGSFLSKTLMANGPLCVYREFIPEDNLRELELISRGGAEAFIKKSERQVARKIIDTHAPNCQGCNRAIVNSDRSTHADGKNLMLTVTVACGDSQCLPAMRAARGGRLPSAAAAWNAAIIAPDEFNREYPASYGDLYDELPFKKSDTHTYTYDAYGNTYDTNESANVGLIVNFLNNLKEANKRDEEELAEIEAMADTLTLPDKPKGDEAGTW